MSSRTSDSAAIMHSGGGGGGNTTASPSSSFDPNNLVMGAGPGGMGFNLGLAGSGSGRRSGSAQLPSRRSGSGMGGGGGGVGGGSTTPRGGSSARDGSASPKGASGTGAGRSGSNATTMITTASPQNSLQSRCRLLTRNALHWPLEAIQEEEQALGWIASGAGSGVSIRDNLKPILVSRFGTNCADVKTAKAPYPQLTGQSFVFRNFVKGNEVTTHNGTAFPFDSAIHFKRALETVMSVLRRDFLGGVAPPTGGPVRGGPRVEVRDVDDPLPMHLLKQPPEVMLRVFVDHNRLDGVLIPTSEVTVRQGQVIDFGELVRGTFVELYCRNLAPSVLGRVFASHGGAATTMYIGSSMTMAGGDDQQQQIAGVDADTEAALAEASNQVMDFSSKKARKRMAQEAGDLDYLDGGAGGDGGYSFGDVAIDRVVFLPLEEELDQVQLVGTSGSALTVTIDGGYSSAIYEFTSQVLGRVLASHAHVSSTRNSGAQDPNGAGGNGCAFTVEYRGPCDTLGRLDFGGDDSVYADVFYRDITSRVARAVQTAANNSQFMFPAGQAPPPNCQLTWAFACENGLVASSRIWSRLTTTPWEHVWTYGAARLDEQELLKTLSEQEQREQQQAQQYAAALSSGGMMLLSQQQQQQQPQTAVLGSPQGGGVHTYSASAEAKPGILKGGASGKNNSSVGGGGGGGASQQHHQDPRKSGGSHQQPQQPFSSTQQQQAGEKSTNSRPGVAGSKKQAEKDGPPPKLPTDKARLRFLFEWVRSLTSARSSLAGKALGPSEATLPLKTLAGRDVFSVFQKSFTLAKNHLKKQLVLQDADFSFVSVVVDPFEIPTAVLNAQQALASRGTSATMVGGEEELQVEGGDVTPAAITLQLGRAPDGSVNRTISSISSSQQGGGNGGLGSTVSNEWRNAALVQHEEHSAGRGKFALGTGSSLSNTVSPQLFFFDLPLGAPVIMRLPPAKAGKPHHHILLDTGVGDGTDASLWYSHWAQCKQRTGLFVTGDRGTGGGNALAQLDKESTIPFSKWAPSNFVYSAGLGSRTRVKNRADEILRAGGGSSTVGGGGGGAKGSGLAGAAVESSHLSLQDFVSFVDGKKPGLSRQACAGDEIRIDHHITAYVVSPPFELLSCLQDLQNESHSQRRKAQLGLEHILEELSPGERRLSAACLKSMAVLFVINGGNNATHRVLFSGDAPSTLITKGIHGIAEKAKLKKKDNRYQLSCVTFPNQGSDKNSPLTLLKTVTATHYVLHLPSSDRDLKAFISGGGGGGNTSRASSERDDAESSARSTATDGVLGATTGTFNKRIAKKLAEERKNSALPILAAMMPQSRLVIPQQEAAARRSLGSGPGSEVLTEALSKLQVSYKEHGKFFRHLTL